MTDVLAAPDPHGAVPAGRGRWRLGAYTRQFSSALPTPIADLSFARGRRLERKWNTPAQLTFTLDGHAPEAAALTELATDVVALRWDDAAAQDRPMFRGLIDHSEDQLGDTYVVTFTAHDYYALLQRRITRSAVSYTQVDQDALVNYLLNAASGDPTFQPGSFLPLAQSDVNPDGTNRPPASGQLRDRNYPAGSVVGNQIDDLAKVINGFDYDVLPNGPARAFDFLRVFYPGQGVTRTDMALVWGVNVNTVTRTVSSADYANYVRVIGNNGTSDPNAAQLYAERWNTDANNVSVNPVGTFMTVENAADATLQATLDQKAQGDLAWYGALTPSYTIGLRPGTYRYGFPNIGDTVPLVIQEGRLNVNTTVRVVGMDFTVGDDGQEDVTLTVGRPPVTMAKLLAGAARDIDALVRR